MINKKTTLGEIVKNYENASEILGGFGMHCLGCPMSQVETIEEAARAHDVELDFMLKKLNDDLVAKGEAKTCTKKRCCKKQK